DDGRSANAESEGKDGDEGEAAVFAKAAEGEAKIAEEVVEVDFPSRVANFFFDAVEAAEFECCAAACFFWADSCGYIACGLTIALAASLCLPNDGARDRWSRDGPGRNLSISAEGVAR